MDGVILVMPGPWAESNYEEADIYTTKIGGVSDFPIPLVDEELDILKCNTCRSHLSLLAQIYAPVSTTSWSIYERLIYVYCCMVPNCESPIWRALRVQKFLSNEGNKSSQSSPSSSKNNWLEDLCSFDNGEEDDDIDIEELSRALTSLNSAGKKQNTCRKSKKKSLSIGQSARSVDVSIPVLPCFYTYTQEEKPSKKATSESSELQISIKEYEQNNKDDSDGETYGEEKYEYDKALNADRTYLKFMKRIDAYPGQCFRYSYGGKPLLASGKMANPESCTRCGGARHFELQLMPTLIYFLLERADDQQRICLGKLDWLTALVYTCSTNCAGAKFRIKSGDDEWIVAEEEVIFQQE